MDMYSEVQIEMGRFLSKEGEETVTFVVFRSIRSGQALLF